ncbi:MAG TPA: glycogen/starch/alpha-glucan phosphorylase [Vicinamibacteria bacterium]
MPQGPVHVLAAEAGSERAAEIAAALRAASRVVREHVLPPAAASGVEDVERLRQEAALVTGAVGGALADGGTLLLSDERAALAVPEMMRALLDGQGLGWDEAWTRTRAVTVCRFGCPKSEPRRPFWRVSFLEQDEPRLLEILYEINRRHLDEVETRWPGDGERRKRLSLFREGDPRRLRPGPLAVIGSAHADVATPWEGPAAEILADLAVLRGKALRSRPTPVFARRWLADGNPALAELLALTLGERWADDASAFPRLETLAFDPAFRGAFRAVRRANRERLAAHLRDAAGVEVRPDSLVDVRLAAHAPHERPLLSVLGLVREHLRLTAGGWTPPAPRTVVLARPAEAAGPGGERLVRLMRSVADAVNRDEKARPALRVAVLPACDDETARLLAAGADLSSQPGTAGSGAAGARALGFAVNGAVTLGTRDGAVRELEEAVGAENLFLFGLGPLETYSWREGRVYRPQDVYAIDPLVRLSLDALVSTRYAPLPGTFDWVRQDLLDQDDPWLVLADLGSYIHRQDEALAEFADPRAFTEKAILTLARARRFWVDRLELEP